MTITSPRQAFPLSNPQMSQVIGKHVTASASESDAQPEHVCLPSAGPPHRRAGMAGTVQTGCCVSTIMREHGPIVASWNRQLVVKVKQNQASGDATIL